MSSFGNYQNRDSSILMLAMSSGIWYNLAHRRKGRKPRRAPYAGRLAQRRLAGRFAVRRRARSRHDGQGGDEMSGLLLKSANMIHSDVVSFIKCGHYGKSSFIKCGDRPLITFIKCDIV